MINNYICENCTHFSVCKVVDKLKPFDEDAKKPLGVSIEIQECENYQDINGEQ